MVPEGVGTGVSLGGVGAGVMSAAFSTVRKTTLPAAATIAARSFKECLGIFIPIDSQSKAAVDAWQCVPFPQAGFLPATSYMGATGEGLGPGLGNGTGVTGGIGFVPDGNGAGNVPEGTGVGVGVGCISAPMRIKTDPMVAAKITTIIPMG